MSTSQQLATLKQINAIQSRSNLKFLGYMELFMEYPHLLLVYLPIFLTTAASSGIYATFGTWMVSTFDLNSQELGIQLLVLSCGEICALTLSTFGSRFDIMSNINQAIVASCVWGVASIVWIIFIAFYLPISIINSDEQIGLRLACLFFYQFSIEWTYLNLIVACLNFTPHGC